MNWFIRGAALFLTLCAGTVLAAESSVQVVSSHDFSLAVVDAGKKTDARDAAHAAFAMSLSEALSKKTGGKLGVRVKCVNADNAAFNLNTGVFDAVVVLGGSMPRALIASDYTRLTGTLGAGKTEKKIYLVFSNSDATLPALLTDSFSVAMTSDRFLDALDRMNGRIEISGGTSVAAMR